jgi:hypothetical protein
MRAKSASHRDIPRGRTERREVTHNEPAQRTRSLTREEESNRRPTSAYERANFSHHFLASSSCSRASRADSHVTFALDKTNCGKSEPKQQRSKEILTQPRELEIMGKHMRIYGWAGKIANSLRATIGITLVYIYCRCLSNRFLILIEFIPYSVLI